MLCKRYDLQIKVYVYEYFKNSSPSRGSIMHAQLKPLSNKLMGQSMKKAIKTDPWKYEAENYVYVYYLQIASLFLHA